MEPAGVSQTWSDTKRKRIPEIDFWRGLALVVIMIDHIPWNGLDYLTPRNFGFSDAAEAFVFLSGVSVSLAYAPSLQKAGFRRLIERCATRAGKIYLVQIVMVVCSIAIPYAAAAAVGDQGILLGQGLSRFANSPLSAIIGAALLWYTPNYSGVLSLYVVLMLWAPVVIFIASRRPALALSLSIAVYAVGRGHHVGGGDGWPFNPFAWQLVFAIGIICASTWRSGLPRPRGPLVALALAIILGAAILSIKAMGLRATAFAYLDLDKRNLGVMRLVHFLALAYVLSAIAIVQPWTRYLSGMIGSAIGQSFQGMGRNSLLFFALGSSASTAGRSLMAAAQSLGAPHLSVHIVGLIYTAAALTGMFMIVIRMDRTASPRDLRFEKINAPAPVSSLRAEVREDPAFP